MYTTFQNLWASTSWTSIISPYITLPNLSKWLFYKVSFIFAKMIFERKFRTHFFDMGDVAPFFSFIFIFFKWNWTNGHVRESFCCKFFLAKLNKTWREKVRSNGKLGSVGETGREKGDWKALQSGVSVR